MDLTDILMKLAAVTGIPVYQDICTDEEADSYITVIYQDERPAFCANNHFLSVHCDIYFYLFSTIDFDFFEIKKKDKELLGGKQICCNVYRYSVGGCLLWVQDSKDDI